MRFEAALDPGGGWKTIGRNSIKDFLKKSKYDCFNKFGVLCAS